MRNCQCVTVLETFDLKSNLPVIALADPTLQYRTKQRFFAEEEVGEWYFSGGLRMDVLPVKCDDLKEPSMNFTFDLLLPNPTLTTVHW